MIRHDDTERKTQNVDLQLDMNINLDDMDRSTTFDHNNIGTNSPTSPGNRNDNITVHHNNNTNNNNGNSNISGNGLRQQSFASDRDAVFFPTIGMQDINLFQAFDHKQLQLQQLQQQQSQKESNQNHDHFTAMDSTLQSSFLSGMSHNQNNNNSNNISGGGINMAGFNPEIFSSILNTTVAEHGNQNNGNNHFHQSHIQSSTKMIEDENKTPIHTSDDLSSVGSSEYHSITNGNNSIFALNNINIPNHQKNMIMNILSNSSQSVATGSMASSATNSIFKNAGGNSKIQNIHHGLFNTMNMNKMNIATTGSSKTSKIQKNNNASTGTATSSGSGIAAVTAHTINSIQQILNVTNNHGHAIQFAFQIPSGQICQNEKIMMPDIRFNLNIKVTLKNNINNSNNIINQHHHKNKHYETFYSTHKWFSDIQTGHETLSRGFSHNIQLPNIQLPLQDKEGSLTESDTLMMQQYLNNLADGFLNHDYTSNHSLQILSILDDDTHSLSDKIKLLALEASLLSALFKNEALENEITAVKNDLYHTRRGLGEVNIVVATLARDLECMKINGVSGSNPGTGSTNNRNVPLSVPTTNNVLRTADQATTSKPTKHNVFAQPSNPTPGLFVKNPPTQNLVINSTKATASVKSQENSYDNVSSSNVIIEFAEIEPNVLVGVTDAILLEKGPLPVGEVGKMLQEVTGNLQLSQLLKEKHNGLKKFLEKFPDKFIMSTDHPFNPHVYLRRCFSADEQKKIEEGCTSFLDEFKKSKKTRRGNNSNNKTKSAWH